MRTIETPAVAQYLLDVFGHDVSRWCRTCFDKAKLDFADRIVPAARANLAEYIKTAEYYICIRCFGRPELVQKRIAQILGDLNMPSLQLFCLDDPKWAEYKEYSIQDVRRMVFVPRTASAASEFILDVAASVVPHDDYLHV